MYLYGLNHLTYMKNDLIFIVLILCPQRLDALDPWALKQLGDKDTILHIGYSSSYYPAVIPTIFPC